MEFELGPAKLRLGRQLWRLNRMQLRMVLFFLDLDQKGKKDQKIDRILGAVLDQNVFNRIVLFLDFFKKN